MKKTHFFLIFFLLSLLFVSCGDKNKNDKTAQATLEISEGWEFRQVGTEKWLRAKVPGSVHIDLLENKKIEAPFYRTNERNQQWIDKEDWEYRTRFSVDAQMLKNDRVELCFEGLDTYAEIFLNDSLLFFANNMFRTWSSDVKNLLQEGENTLRVVLHSPIKIGLAKLDSLGYPLKASNDQAQNGNLGDKKVSIFTRKAGYHYGWDWGPRFVTSGIWRPVKLKAWSGAAIENVQVVLNDLTDQKAKLKATFEIEAEQKQELSFAIAAENDEKVSQTIQAQVKKGKNKVDLEFEIENPKLWWSNGLGEPFLYQLKAEIKNGNTVLDTESFRYGVRTVRVVQEPDSLGKSFYVELNGQPVFMKGANYIPNDNFLNRVTPEKYEHIIQSAADANMNMLRVWGGGIYENDIFYELCDEKGILVWQDFMFACSLYPGDEPFLENVKQEAIDNVKRLRNHACIALWCGNNENYSAWNSWGWKQYYQENYPDKVDEIWQAYEDVFYEILPQVAKQYDGTRFYWPSSPMADWKELATYESTSGDMHYWGVWHGKKPFSTYKEVIPRFSSEYGFQSFPEMKTVKSYTKPKDRDIESEVMQAHQRHPVGNQLIRTYMERHYKVPEKFEHLLYIGQLLQAQGVNVALEGLRTHKPYCMGSLYWQLNDCWPVASWSGMDYYGRWKALHFFAKKAYATDLISPVTNDDQFQVFVVSDRLEAYKAQADLKILDLSGKELFSKTLDFEVKANSSQKIFDKQLKALLSEINPKNAVLLATLSEGDKVLSRNTYYFAPVKELTLPRPNLKTKVEKTETGYKVSLTAEKLAKNVFLTSQTDGQFSDNFIDVLPGETLSVEFLPKGNAENFESTLKTLTVFDTL